MTLSVKNEAEWTQDSHVAQEDLDTEALKQ